MQDKETKNKSKQYNKNMKGAKRHRYTSHEEGECNRLNQRA